MIIETGDKTHPKAEILLIDFKTGKVDFKWLEEDESPSKIYSGDCSMMVNSVDLRAATTLDAAKPLLTSKMILESGLKTEIIVLGEAEQKVI